MSKSTKITAIVAAAMLGLLGTACSPKAEVAAAPAPPPEVEQAEEQEPEPPAPKDMSGSLENPWPINYELVVSNRMNVDVYSLSASVVSADAEALLLEANQFNDPAPEGQRYVLIEVTITGLDPDEPVMPGVESFSWNLADQDGNLYRSASAVTPGEGISGGPDLYAGQSFTGQIAYLVPSDSSAIYFSAFGKYVQL